VRSRVVVLVTHKPSLYSECPTIDCSKKSLPDGCVSELDWKNLSECSKERLPQCYDSKLLMMTRVDFYPDGRFVSCRSG
jgi:hypothetical protein